MPDINDGHSDLPRPVATDRDYTLTIDEVAERYVVGGHPRTIRTLQRYCASGHLDCQKVQTALGDKYMVAPYSVVRHLAQIAEVIAFSNQATGRDQPRPVAIAVAHSNDQEFAESRRPTGDDPSRLVATRRGNDHYSDNQPPPPRELERLEEENTFLRDQIRTKDKQIDALLERDRETNILVRGLQEMLTPLLGPRHSEPRQHDQHVGM